MRLTLEQRVRFAEKNLTDPKGMPFSLEGRAWVRDLWAAMDGFKSWPVEKETTCDACRARVGEISTDEKAWDDTRSKKHAKGCTGLAAEPIYYVVLCVERRAGKSFNFFAFAAGELFLEDYRSTLYVAAAKDQSGTIAVENLKGPISRKKALARLAKITGNAVEVPKRHSKLEIVPTSHSSITGRGRTRVVIDEARDVHGRVAAALLPSILESQWVECPHSHTRTPLAGDEKPKSSTCAACGAELVRTVGRMLLMSSAGITSGNPEDDWFSDLVRALEEEPHPNYHLIRLDEGANPMKSRKAMDAATSVLGRVEGLRTFVAAEIGNQFLARGEDFLSATMIKAVTDKKLKNREGSSARSVAFLDTSISKELTSLVILAADVDEDDPKNLDPWARAVVERIDVWTPAELPGGLIDERLVQEHLDLYMPLFPRLARLAVDVRLMPWAERLVRLCNTKRPAWGRRVIRFTGRDLERDTAWALLEARIRAGTIRIPAHPALLAELGALKTKERGDGRRQVTDASRKKRHADLSDGLAYCCYLAHLETITHRTTLRDAADKQRPGAGRKGADLLQRVFRREVRGFGPNSF